jgi:hypothetical protein
VGPTYDDPIQDPIFIATMQEFDGLGLRSDQFKWQLAYLDLASRHGFEAWPGFRHLLGREIYRHRIFTEAWPEKRAGLAAAEFQKEVGPHLGAIRNAVGSLKEILQKAGRKRMKELTEILRAAETAEAKLEGVLLPGIEESLQERVGEYGVPPAAGSERRLALNLNIDLRVTARLTLDARANLIVVMLDHFGIEPRTDQSFDRIRKAITRKRIGNREVDLVLLERRQIAAGKRFRE